MATEIDEETLKKAGWEPDGEFWRTWVPGETWISMPKRGAITVAKLVLAERKRCAEVIRNWDVAEHADHEAMADKIMEGPA